MKICKVLNSVRVHTTQQLRNMATSRPDVIIIGAGPAGIGAATCLLSQPSPPRILVLEARSRTGGRAYTLQKEFAYPIDLGAQWLHYCPENNPLHDEFKHLVNHPRKLRGRAVHVNQKRLLADDDTYYVQAKRLWREILRKSLVAAERRLKSGESDISLLSLMPDLEQIKASKDADLISAIDQQISHFEEWDGGSLSRMSAHCYIKSEDPDGHNRDIRCGYGGLIQARD